jgi:hypothetical protein
MLRRTKRKRYQKTYGITESNLARWKLKPEDLVAMNFTDEDRTVWKKARSEHWREYRKGGLHPAELGDDIKGYRLIRKLGWGSYATVWLARSSK